MGTVEVDMDTVEVVMDTVEADMEVDMVAGSMAMDRGMEDLVVDMGVLEVDTGVPEVDMVVGSLMAGMEEGSVGVTASRSVMGGMAGNNSSENKDWKKKGDTEELKKIELKYKEGGEEEEVEEEEVELLLGEDHLGCARMLVCELASRSPGLLPPPHQAVLSFVRSEGSRNLNMKPGDERANQSEAASGMARLWKASEEGRGGAQCSKLYPKCPFTANGVMEIVREVAEAQ
ncbi:hypothetical protein E2C01_084250 [Portunus trituberculatus]|uniref:Uncharacterized protein n=1 Tax=Portunus trituberculatus TaxID=210409 RepID=A0A5B7IXS7_PORTR|nr:hypothetical protein [Portunus trituberculatus]